MINLLHFEFTVHSASSILQELGFIKFLFESGGPSQMDVWIPGMSATRATTAPLVWQPSNEEETIEFAVNVSVCIYFLYFY